MQEKQIAPANESQNCQFCNHSQFKTLFAAPPFDRLDDPHKEFLLVRCIECGLVKTSPFLNPEELSQYYAKTYYGEYTQKFNTPIEKLVGLSNLFRAKNFLRQLSRPQEYPQGEGINQPRLTGKALPWIEGCFSEETKQLKVLDVGCGRGEFLRALKKLGAECYGLEIPGFEFPKNEKNLTFLHGTVEALPFQKGFFSGISIWHVLEHTSNPFTTLKKLAELLQPNGIISIAVPNFGSFQRKIFGPSWFHLDLPRHLFHFDQVTLISMLEQVGLQPFEISTSSISQNWYSFVQSTLNRILWKSQFNFLYGLLKHHEMQMPSWKRATFLLLYFPLCTFLLALAALEDILSRFFGKGATLIIFARKIKK